MNFAKCIVEGFAEPKGTVDRRVKAIEEPELEITEMIGFGSIWTRRVGRDAAALYNTTGVPVGDSIRPRSRVYGVARFNGSSGFTPHQPERMLHRVFECSGPASWNGANRELVERLEAGAPDVYLAILRSGVVGWLDARSASWCARDCVLISFSESGAHQEAMLLMPAYSWVRESNGICVLEPAAPGASRARLVSHR